MSHFWICSNNKSGEVPTDEHPSSLRPRSPGTCGHRERNLGVATCFTHANRVIVENTGAFYLIHALLLHCSDCLHTQPTDDASPFLWGFRRCQSLASRRCCRFCASAAFGHRRAQKGTVFQVLHYKPCHRHHYHWHYYWHYCWSSSRGLWIGSWVGGRVGWNWAGKLKIQIGGSPNTTKSHQMGAGQNRTKKLADAPPWIGSNRFSLWCFTISRPPNQMISVWDGSTAI